MKTPIRGAALGGLVVAVAMTAILLAACGSAGSAAGPAYGGTDGGQGQNGGMPAASRAPVAQGEDPAAAPDEGGVGQGDTAAVRDGAKIIRTGSLQMEVADVPAALTAARNAIVRLGGFIGASQQYREGANVYATITYRIPVDRWEDALDSLRGLGTEVGEQTDSADVTSQIVDLEARIRNLKASETALVSYLANATRVEDLLEIESRLSGVRGQIEQLEAQKVSLDDQIAYATLAVTFGTEAKVIEVAAKSWDPGGEIEQAGASLLGFLQALATAGIWFAIVWLPILLVLGIVVGVILFVAKRLGYLGRPTPPAAMPPAPPPLPPAPAAG